jgi:hypothetical protein
MTKKTRIETDLDEILSYLDIDRPTAQRLVQAGVKRLLLEPEIDPRINAYLHNDPPKTNSKLEA